MSTSFVHRKNAFGEYIYIHKWTFPNFQNVTYQKCPFRVYTYGKTIFIIFSSQNKIRNASGPYIYIYTRNECVLPFFFFFEQNNTKCHRFVCMRVNRDKIVAQTSKKWFQNAFGAYIYILYTKNIVFHQILACDTFPIPTWYTPFFLLLPRVTGCPPRKNRLRKH